MLAIRTIFVAITGIQASLGNAFPRLTAWIVLAGHLFVPILSLMGKYLPQQNKVIVVLSVGVSTLVVLAITMSASKFVMKSEVTFGLKLKIASIVFFSMALLIGIARISPEFSLIAYLVFCAIPLQSILKIRVEEA